MENRNIDKKAPKIIGGYTGKVRSSNLELLRIIAMLTIVAHHSVINSGITEY